jgi:uncharacterized protein with beta-barrel porin domain
VSPSAPSPLVVNGVANLIDTHFAIDINDPNPARAATYKAISATGGLHVSGGDVTATSTSFVPVLKFDASTLMVTLLNYNAPLAGVATGLNANGAGRAIDAVKRGSTGDFGQIVRELTALTDPALNRALAEMSGEIQASTIRLSAIDLLSVTTTIQNEVSDAEHQSQGGQGAGGAWAPQMWFQMGGDHSSFSSGEYSGGTANIGGGVGGVNFRPSSSITLGGGAALSLGGLSLSEISASSQITSPRAFFYGGYGLGKFHLHWGGSTSWAKTTTKRTIQFAATVPNADGVLVPMSEGVDREAVSHQKSTARDFWGDVQYTRQFGKWTYDGKVGLRFAGFTRKAFAETGADSISLDVAGGTLSTRDTNVDFRAFRHAGTWRPNIWFSFRREFGAEWTHAEVAFAGAPGVPFTVQGLPVPKTIIQGLLGMTMRSAAKLGYTLDYQFLWTNDEYRHSLRFKVRF